MGGMVGAEGAATEVESGVDDSVVVLLLFRGDMFVGPLSTKSRMRSGVFSGVTLSMNWKEGRRSTVVLLSEWSGTGMSEAESMSLCHRLVAYFNHAEKEHSRHYLA